MHKPIFLALALLLPLLPSPTAAAAPQAFTADAAHSRINFVAYTKIFDAVGVFKKWSAKAQLDPADLSQSQIEVTVQVASVDTDSGKRDEHLRKKDFFWVEKYPTAHFKSSKFVVKSADLVEVHGTLTVRGVSKKIAIPLQVKRSKQGKRDVIALKGETTLNRRDFNINYEPGLLLPSIKDNVSLQVAITLLGPKG